MEMEIAAERERDARMSEHRYREAQQGVWLGIIVNLILAIVKGVAGFVSGSRALMADAVHSATDVVGSIAIWYGVRMAHIPPDEEHPYGHGKAETIAAIVVAVLIAGVGAEVGYRSFEALFEPIQVAPSWVAAGVALASILVKEGMFRYTLQLGKKVGGQAMIVHAWEHRSDVFSSLAALFGIVGAIMGAKWKIPQLVYLDPLAGLIVSLFVLYMAYQLAKGSMGHAIDKVLDRKESAELFHAAEKVNGVKKVDQLLARQHGHYVIVDIKVAVEPTITVKEGHQIGKQVKKALTEQFVHVSDVMVHINPHDANGEIEVTTLE
jgi:cation diffusion facilitator family transporter